MARYSVDYDGDLSTTDDRVSYNSFNDAVGSINSQGFDSYSIQDNRRGGGGGLGSFGSDRSGREAGFAALNEARPVRSGLGGLLGGIFGGQRQGGGLFGYTGLRDMVDGAGPGASGSQFRGGLYSGLLNAIGVSPLGQGQRAQMAASPSLAPQGARPLPASVSPQTERSFVPQQSTSPTTRPVPRATRPLTAQDVDMLTRAGMGMDAQVGLPATPEELAFLDARTGGVGPSAMASVAQPGMNVMADGETFLRQNIANVPNLGTGGPFVTTPQTDPRVGGRYAGMRRPMPQIEGIRPIFTSTTPPPAVNPMSASAADLYLPPDPFRANQLRAYGDMQSRAVAGLLGR